MAETDTTSKNLQTSVDRLSEELDTIEARLEEQRSHLSSIQLQFDEFAKGGDPRAERASLARHQEALTQIAEALRPKLDELDQIDKRLRLKDEQATRLATELKQQSSTILNQQNRLRQLQSDFQFLRSSVEGFDGSPGQNIVDLANRIETVERQILRLSEVQDTLELQTALLSKEAETSAVQVSADRKFFDLRKDLEDRLDALSEQVRRLAQQTQHGPGPSADANKLAVMIDELSSSLHEKERRLEGLDQRTAPMRSPAPASDAQQLAGLLAALNERAVETDEMASRLEQRTAALDSRQAERDQEKAEVFSQIRELDRRLCTLSGETRTLLAVQAGETTSSFDSRFDELHGELKSLRKQFAEEQVRIEKLQQLEKNLAARLDAAADSARVSKQGMESLRENHRKLSEQLRRLDGRISDGRQVNSDLENRVAMLHMAQKEQAKSTEDLGLRQTRQDVDNQALRKSGRQRSAFGLLALLLLAGGLAYLLQFDAVKLATPQQLAEVEATAEHIIATTRSDIGREIAELRRELTVSDDSVAQLRYSVDALDSASLRALPEQLDSLLKTVAMLSEQAWQQDREIGALKAAQVHLPGKRPNASNQLDDIDGNDALAKSLDTASDVQKYRPQKKPKKLRTSSRAASRSDYSKGRQQPEAEPKTTQRTDIEKKSSGKASPWSADKRPPKASISQASAHGLSKSSQWAQAQAERRYTLQLGGFHNRKLLERFVRVHRIASGSAVYRTRHQGRTWYVLFYGTYHRVDQAVAASHRLPANVAAQNPWVRRLPHTGNLEMLDRGVGASRELSVN